ncbi:MAG: hypothetical protein JJE52_09600 [Acidimicrobiia bacterium]|nr:hypothetical protein [Acidimicrobiia bacterium]
MPSLSFDGETHDEIVQKVRRWLATADDAGAAETLTPAEAVSQGAALTKDALRVIAAAAPGPVASSDVVKALTAMGYQATDATRDAVLAGLDALEQATGGGLVKKVSDAGSKAAYEMNVAIAKQVFRSVTGR